MKIEFVSNFKELNYLEKRSYIEKLINNYSLESIFLNLIDEIGVIETFKIINDVSKTPSYKTKYKIKKIELASFLINILVSQNKNKELVEYLDYLDLKTLKAIVVYETKNETVFSKTKLCKNLYNEYKISKSKRVINYNDLMTNTKKVLKKELGPKTKIGVGTTILIIILSVAYLLVGSLYTIIFYYNNHVYPNTYIDNKSMDGERISDINNYLNNLETNLTKEISFTNVNDTFTYSYKDIGLLVNTSYLKEEINKYKDLNGFLKLKEIFSKEERRLNISYSFDEKKYQEFLNKLRSDCETEEIKESFKVVNGNINYQKGLNGFKLKTDDLEEKIINNLKNNLETPINLTGEVVEVSNILSSIDSKVSTFTTTYLESQRRSINIKEAVKRINGTIVYPNETFSFSKTAGLASTKGYVFYGKYIGSGVCQVSTTIYNNQLLLNLPIVSRSNHGEMVPYVDYGMDATVYGTTTDYKFKNNTKYPIYIEATANNGNLTVSFWSNENIIEKGYSYKPRSVKIGNLAYKTYLDTYYNGELIKSTYLNSSYYYKGK